MSHFSVTNVIFVIGKPCLFDRIELVIFAHIIEIACQNGILGMAYHLDKKQHLYFTFFLFFLSLI